MNVLKSTSSSCVQNDREYGFDVVLGQVVLCRKLRWICRKRSNDVARQIETTSKRTIFIARHNFHVASVVTLYHDCKQVNAAIDVFLV